MEPEQDPGSDVGEMPENPAQPGMNPGTQPGANDGNGMIISQPGNTVGSSPQGGSMNASMGNADMDEAAGCNCDVSSRSMPINSG